MNLLRVWESEEVDKVWIFVKDYIQKALDSSGSYADHEHIKDQVKKNMMQLWVAFEEKEQQLAGNAKEQFAQWRGFLKTIYELEKTPAKTL